jgi:hypothetical protein
LRRAVGPGFSLYTDIAQDLSDFVADPEDLYFVLLNLCRNASAALRGEVVILAKNSVPVRGASTKVVEIIVADNGSGIADEVLRNNGANDDDACIETGRRKQCRPIQFNCNILGPWEDGSECD